ncbi:Sphingosine N-acyltransferase lag1 [Colletotrichum tanaceti]|uniref:Sphingosine N-acyltransferase lag1 n=1 Tax=Colletotrichum tanaceti TaxID=1306861 RepID=A0A4V6DGL3_9PEZI|nr:Sphingosine N-acyltransferase lag1 [Colletotrichum tanaceti]TKW51936.1 Sphingosine N-acyltransferase lag1 [Colletotrichum tanaceti]
MSEPTTDTAYANRAPGFSSTATRTIRRKATPIEDSRRRRLVQWLFDNQINLAFHTIAPLLIAHICVPAARPYTSKFLQLSYYNATTGQYGAGHDDLCFVGFCVVLLIGIRAALMRHALGPLGRHCGISTKKDINRFSEQGWMLVYYGVIWPLGMSLYYRAPYYLDMKELWVDWPQRELGGLMKGYVMVQWAYWVQQVISVNIEARRKDYWEMIVHHAITISLIASCYAYHQTRVGHLILVLMDVIELIFPLAKCLKYVGFTTLCDAIFGVFLLVWVWTRHVFFLMTCWSVYYDLPRSLEQPCFRGAAGEVEGPFSPPADGWSHILEPFMDPTGTVCMTDDITKGFLIFLLALEVVICVWSLFIVRVTVRVLKGAPAEDVRSDVEVDEEGEEEEEEMEDEEVEAIEEEVGVESIHLPSWQCSVPKKDASPRASGVRTASGRKELLNRIGCEKQID